MKTLILIGGGVKDIYEDVRKFVGKYKLPIVHSLNGKGIISDDYNFHCGMIGWKGSDFANDVLKRSERLIVLGSRLDIRQIPDLSILNNKEIYMVETNTDKNIEGTYYKYFDQFIANYNYYDNWEWVNDSDIDVDEKYPFMFLNLNMQEYYVTTDVGDNQMLVANKWSVDNPYKFITSGGLGTMGFAIPAAIGVACQGHPTLAICGDGGFQMNIQELETIKYNNLPIKIMVINNNRLNLVKTFQDENNLINQSTVEGYSCPNIEKIANAYGFKYTVDENEFLRYNQIIYEKTIK